jgi:hypothetical protein
LAVLLAGAVSIVGSSFGRSAGAAPRPPRPPPRPPSAQPGTTDACRVEAPPSDSLICATALSTLICSSALPISGVDFDWLLPLTPLFS